VHPTFRYGLLAIVVLSMGQFGMTLALALFLQESLHLTALDNGLWMLPFGLLILVSAPIGGRLAHRISTVSVVRIGLVSQTAALVYIAFSLSTHMTFLRLLPGLMLYGIGGGFSMSQLTNVVLSQIPNNKSGVASGTNTTVRQVGSALGIAVIGTVVTVQTTNGAVRQIGRSTLDGSIKREAIARVHALGANYSPSVGSSSRVAKMLSTVVARAVANASHDAVLFAAAVVAIGTLLSSLIPTVAPESHVAAVDEPVSAAAIDPEAVIG
jgi:MFS family permease